MHRDISAFAMLLVASCSHATGMERPVPDKPVDHASNKTDADAESPADVTEPSVSPTVIRPGGPVNAPVPGLGPQWSTLTADDIAGEWILHRSEGDPCSLTLGLNGLVETTGSPCADLPMDFSRWQFDSTNHLDFFSPDGRNRWRLRRMSDQRFLGAHPPLSRFILARRGDDVGTVAPFPDRKVPRRSKQD